MVCLSSFLMIENSAFIPKLTFTLFSSLISFSTTLVNFYLFSLAKARRSLLFTFLRSAAISAHTHLVHLSNRNFFLAQLTHFAAHSIDRFQDYPIHFQSADLSFIYTHVKWGVLAQQNFINSTHRGSRVTKRLGDPRCVEFIKFCCARNPILHVCPDEKR